MQLDIKMPTLPAAIEGNFEELKQQLHDKMDRYRGAVYTDDQMRDAKQDLAMLRKLEKALSDERIRIKKEWLKPYEAFESNVKELAAIVHEPIALISAQTKDFEERKKAEKRAAIYDYWAETGAPEWLHTIKPSWLNASYAMKTIKAEIDANIQQTEKQLDVIRKLPQYAFEAEEHYKVNHSLDAAISEAYRLQELDARKAAYEAEKAKNRETLAAAGVDSIESPGFVPAEPKREWIAFQALLSPEEARALGQFMKSHGIQYKAV